MLGATHLEAATEQVEERLRSQFDWQEWLPEKVVAPADSGQGAVFELVLSRDEDDGGILVLRSLANELADFVSSVVGHDGVEEDEVEAILTD